MKVIKAITHADYEDLLLMLSDYIIELHNIDPTHVKLRSDTELSYEYFYTEDTDFYLLYSEENAPIGFAVIGHDSNCHPLADMYINEFYIKPSYRNNGYGRDLFEGIQSLLPTEIDRLCMYILKNNTNAIEFWSRALNPEWIDVTYAYSNNTPKHLLWYMYERR
jgi:predicted acetyltransferase